VFTSAVVYKKQPMPKREETFAFVILHKTKYSVILAGTKLQIIRSKTEA
jgi:hypothetical protein